MHKLLTAISLLTSVGVYSQEYASSEYYLIDSLDLNIISSKDRTLIDSILVRYHDCISDTCKINAISTIVEESWDENVWPLYNTWLKGHLEDKMQQETDTTLLAQFKRSYAGCLNNIGFHFNSTGQIDAALDYFFQTLNIQREISDKSGMANTFINIASIYHNRGLIESSLNYYLNSLSLHEETDNQVGIASALNGIGFIHYKQNETEKALESYERSLNIREQLNDRYGVATCLNNLGLLYKDQAQWEKSLDHYHEALGIVRELADKNGEALIMNNIAWIHKNLGHLSESLNYYTRSLEIGKELSDKNIVSHVLNELSTIKLAQGELESGRIHGLRSLKLSQELNFPANIRNAAETLAKIFKKTNQWKEALIYTELYMQMRDSIFNEDTQAAVIHQNYKYEYEKKALTDSILNAQQLVAKNARLAMLEVQDEQRRMEVDRQRGWLFLLVLGLLVVILIALLIYIRFSTVNRQKRLIEIQKASLEKLNKDLKRFAQVISHDLKTPLRGISNLVRMIEEDNPHLVTELGQSFKLIKERCSKMSHLIEGVLDYSRTEMGNQKLELVDTNITVKSALGLINNDKEIDIKVNTSLPVLKCNKIQIEQVFVNLIGNAIKYNNRPVGEGVVNVDHSFNNGLHNFTISDNGPGISDEMQLTIFEPYQNHAQVNGIESTRIGLSLVRDLVNKNGGTIGLKSKLGAGSAFTFTWPDGTISGH